MSRRSERSGPHRSAVESLESRVHLAAHVVNASLDASGLPTKLIIDFSDDVSRAFTAATFSLINLIPSQMGSTPKIDFSNHGERATISWPYEFGANELPDGRYTLHVHAADGSIQDYSSSNLTILQGDANGDGLVNSKDLAALDRGYRLHLHGVSNGDFNWDGRVDAADYDVLAQQYGKRTPPIPGTIDDFTLVATARGELDPVTPPVPVNPSGPSAVGVTYVVSTDGHTFYHPDNDFLYNLPDGQRYYYRARFYGRGQDTPFTAKKSVVTILPSPSGLLVQEQDDGSLHLTWTDNSNNESGFQVLESVDGGTFAVVATTAANATSADLPAPNSSDALQFRVQAFTPFITSAPSVPNMITLAGATNLTAAPATNSSFEMNFNLAWTDNSVRSTGYEVWRYSGDMFEKITTLSGDATTYQTTAASDSNAATFWVRAIFKDEQSAYSNSAWSELPTGGFGVDENIQPLDGSAQLFAQGEEPFQYPINIPVNDNFDDNNRDQFGNLIPDDADNAVLPTPISPNDPDLQDAWLFFRQSMPTAGTWQLNFNDSVRVDYFANGQWTRDSSEETHQTEGDTIIPLKIEGIAASQVQNGAMITLIYKTATRTEADPLEVTVLARKPATPTGLVASLNERGRPRLQWVQLGFPQVAYYNFYRSLDGKTFDSIGLSDAPFPIAGKDDDLSDDELGKTVYYRVTAVNALMYESDPATVKIFVPVDNDPPVLPKSFTATATKTGVALSWSASPSTDIEHYEVFWRDRHGDFILRSTEYTDFSSLSDFDYGALGRGADQYGLVAVDFNGNRSTMKLVSVRDLERDVTPPAAPKNVIVTRRAGGGYFIHWDSNTESDFDHYYIELEDGSFQVTTDNFYVDASATIEQFPAYFVYAVDDVGNVSDPGRPDTTPPHKPFGLHATPTADGVMLTWKRPGDADLQSYEIIGSDQATVDFLLPADQTRFLDDHAIGAPDEGALLNYSLVAIDAYGNRSSPARVSAISQLNAPTELQVDSVAPGQAALHWNDTAGDTAQIYRSDQSDFVPSAASLVASVSDDDESFIDTHSLTPGKTYFYKIVLKTAVATSAASDAVRFDAPTGTVAPPAPPDFFGAFVYTDERNTISLSWNLQFSALSYRIEHFNSTTNTWDLIVKAAPATDDDAEYFARGYDQTQVQRFRIRSVNGWGVGRPLESDAGPVP